jgi:Tol biopolymer transport system component
VHGASEIWTVDLGRGVESRLTNHPAADESPIWSRDGRQIAFNTDRLGLYGVAIVPANGSAEARMLIPPLAASDTWIRDWSVDGAALLLEVSNPKTNSDLWVAPFNDPARARPYLTTEAIEENGRFSPDGKWIAYNGNDSGREEVYIQSYPRSDLRYQVSTRGGGSPAWTADGEELIFESGGAVVSVPIVRRGAELEPGTPRTLFAVPADAVSLGHTVRNRIEPSPDGQKFLLPIYIDGRKPIDLHIIAER